MNINREIASRALAKAGQEPLNNEDIEKNSARWRVIKEFYLQTILETLSNTEWTSQKKRALLLEVEDEDNLTEFKHMYYLPIDCAKPEELLGKEEYIVEGEYLYTDEGAAILMYISNGKRAPVKDELPEEETELPDDILTDTESDELPEEDDTEEIPDETEDPTGPEEPAEDIENEEDEEEEEDYPEYNELKLDPLLTEYIETRLASKIVLKITGDTQLYNMLYQEAALMEQRAVESTKVHSRSKMQGDKWWSEEIGIV